MPPLAASTKKHEHTLWVHSTSTDKGDLPEGIFNLVILKCNKIKVDSINKGETEFLWSPSMKGQPFYDAVKKCGKIICHNQQTVDFWVKWIPLASDMIGPINCKAWTKKEYDNTNVIYSCLIPQQTCIDVDIGDIIKACLIMYNIKNMEGVVKCYTSHTFKNNQRICILEVTESLAAIFETHSQILSGPTGQLTFQLRSGGSSETTEDLMVIEESMPSCDTNKP